MIKEIVVHNIKMGDVEDPDLFVAEPIYNWQQTEMGKFVMSRAVETPRWVRGVDQYTYGYNYAIMAAFDEKTLTEFYLRYGPVKK